MSPINRHVDSKRIFLWVLIIALVILARDAGAGARLDCRDARIFPEADVNALILPYRYGGGDHPASTAQNVGDMLAPMVQQDTLFSMLKYSSVGATELVSNDGQLCDVNIVLSRITRPDNQNRLRPNKGLALVWGRIYEHGTDVFVQSYVRFLIQTERKEFSVPLRMKSDAVSFEVALPAQGVAFAPRHIKKQDFLAIRSNAERVLVLRDAPRESANIIPYNRGPSEPLSYWVEGEQEGWMKIRSQLTGHKGWVKAQFDSEKWALRRFLPELNYLDGVIAYLWMRIDTKRVNNNRAHDWAQKYLALYEAEVGIDGAREAAALSRILRGHLHWMRSRNGQELAEAQAAAKLFREAVDLTPDSSDALNLAAVTSPWIQKPNTLSRDVIIEINKGLLSAIAVDSKNRQVLANLDRLYRYLKSDISLSPYSQAVLDERLLILNEALAGADR